MNCYNTEEQSSNETKRNREGCLQIKPHINFIALRQTSIIYFIFDFEQNNYSGKIISSKINKINRFIYIIIN